MTISTSRDAPVTAPFEIDVAFSETVTGFTLSDLDVGNGTATDLQGDDRRYTASISPDAAGTLTVDIPANAARDEAGNGNEVADQFSIEADPDIEPPTVTISSDAVGPVSEAFTVTVAFSEPVMGFELGVLAVRNGEATELQGSGPTYTATITPEATGTVSVRIAAGTVQDAAGNPNTESRFSIEADLDAPTVTITSEAVEPVTMPFEIAVTFSEAVTGFELEDLVVEGGEAWNLMGVEESYTATVTPTAVGAVTVDIPEGAAEDEAGNPSEAAEQFAIVSDVALVPALPLLGTLMLAIMLAVGAVRRRRV